jgi:hypothetical protein
MKQEALKSSESFHNANLAGWEKASGEANAMSNLLQHVLNGQVHQLEDTLQQSLERLTNLTHAINRSNTVIEESIGRNTEQLEHQAEAISRVRFSGDEFRGWATIFLILVLLQPISGFLRAAVYALASISLMVLNIPLLSIFVQLVVLRRQAVWLTERDQRHLCYLVLLVAGMSSMAAMLVKLSSRLRRPSIKFADLPQGVVLQDGMRIHALECI